MPKPIFHLIAAYRAMLWLYPRELRGTYGSEMALVFEQQLRTEWARRGMRGVLAASSSAIREVVTIAIPGRLLSERIIAPGASLVITSALFMGLVAVLQDRALAGWINHKFLFGGACR
jgi:hypothetical protein